MKLFGLFPNASVKSSMGCLISLAIHVSHFACNSHSTQQQYLQYELPRMREPAAFRLLRSFADGGIVS